MAIPEAGGARSEGHPGGPFGSIESAHEYVGILLEALEETAADVGHELHGPNSSVAVRRRQAFQLVAYKLEQLRIHVATTRRLLNDLRTLRRMLHGERAITPMASVIRVARGVATAPGTADGGPVLFEPAG